MKKIAFVGIHKQSEQHPGIVMTAFHEQCRSRDIVRIVLERDGRRRVRDHDVDVSDSVAGSTHCSSGDITLLYRS